MPTIIDSDTDVLLDEVAQLDGLIEKAQSDIDQMSVQVHRLRVTRDALKSAADSSTQPQLDLPV